MITNEEVKKELGDKVIFSTIPITMNYFKQQEKKDKLLELKGRALNASIIISNQILLEEDINEQQEYLDALMNEIDKLEEELK